MKKIKLWKVKFLLLGQRQHERLKHEINRFYAQWCVAYIESIQLYEMKSWKFGKFMKLDGLKWNHVF